MEERQAEIFAYLSGQMPEAERQAFEQKVEAAPALAQEVEKQRPVFTASRLQGQLRLKQHMQEWEAELSQEKTGRVRTFPSWIWGAVAAAVLVILFFSYQINRSTPEDSETLFAAYYEPFAPPINVRSENENELTAWQQGAQAYTEGAYAKAAEAFSQADADLPVYLRAFYQAQALMAQESPDFALAVSLLQVVQSSDNDYQQAATWYMALINIRLEDYSRAKEILKGLDGYKEAEVQALLERLP